MNNIVSMLRVYFSKLKGQGGYDHYLKHLSVFLNYQRVSAVEHFLYVDLYIH